MGGACCRRASSFHLPLSPRTCCTALCKAVRLAGSLDSRVQSSAHSGTTTMPRATANNPLVLFMAILPVRASRAEQNEFVLQHAIRGSLLAAGLRLPLQPIELGVSSDEQAAVVCG